MSPHLVKLSRFLALVLRHDPGSIGLRLDRQGWALVDELIACAQAHGRGLSRELLLQIVAENDKQRFALSADRRMIRASQGHSIPVELELEPCAPPEELFHGTAGRNLPSIRAQGLVRGRRHHVHLSPDRETARRVGARHGAAVVLVVRSGEMHGAGHGFYRSDNGVWLTDTVPPEFLRFPP